MMQFMSFLFSALFKAQPYHKDNPANFTLNGLPDQIRCKAVLFGIVTGKELIC
jgi:hypothetical protein